MKTMTSRTMWTLLVLAVVLTSVLGQGNCPYVYPHCSQQRQNWHVGMDRVRAGGTRVHGHASGNIHQSPSGSLQGTVHGQRVIGGPYSGAQTVGGGVNYQHSGGLHGGVDASHTRGAGTSYSGHVGGSTKVGPGTLSVGGGVGTVPGSSRVQGQVGATYTAPLPG